MTRDQLLDRALARFEELHKHLKAARAAPRAERPELAERAMRAGRKAIEAAELFYRSSGAR